MTSQGYKDWVKAGKPYNLITPAKALKRNIGASGITVFDYPDESHQRATVPEDHTPYSVTGWPGKNARWNARGLDIMPRSDSAAHRKENADIARQLIRDRDAGVPGVAWIKYINWTNENGDCYHVAWQPTKIVTLSSDEGHVHVSGRSDFDTYTGAEDYNPVTRMSISGGNAMADAATNNTNEIVYAVSQLDADAVIKIPSNGAQDPVNTPLPLVTLLKDIKAAVVLLAAKPPVEVPEATLEALVVAMKTALLDPEILAALRNVAFQGAQQAEQE